ncbi:MULTISPECIES: DUF7287 family protein [Halolamina]|uniref:Uncharacterized protein n=1 Tax=Halolamina pelagica TaxID=699431 RepID=A0A1I5MZQ4_9EURY|nr:MULTISPECIES: hypothetical protein [Halolamina]NHX36231.1 hypothetical protein [Halolamina sp. R1-12]SFP14832.1 hypothetical protein SAMN05216277_101477 [Halolamina pelagica]
MSRPVDDERGQTVLDYAIGVGIFLVAVTFVVATIPGMFAPFVGAGDAQIADRVATSVATERLGAPDEPYLLDRNCTVAFFDQLDGGTTVPSDCRFDTDATTIQGMFALEPGQAMQIRIENTGGGAAVVDGTTLAAGSDPPSGVSVTTARRTVAIDGTTYWLEVRAW